MKAVLGLISVLFLVPTLVSAFTFTENLRVGSTGTAVLELQKLLNQDLDTTVALSGAGSPGSETNTFGALTKSAVVKFQEKYKSEVLIPAGLEKGSGFVGELTRKKMGALSSGVGGGRVSVPVNPTIPRSADPIKPSMVPTQATTTSVLDKVEFDQDSFLSALDTVGIKQGYSRDQLTQIKEVAQKYIAQEKPEKRFVADFQKGGVPIHGIQSSFKPTGIFSTIFNAIGKFLTPEKAYAFGTPFGGQVLFPFFCTCSGNWLITMRPYAPTYVVLLTYYTGTQMYMGYNIPFTLYMVGEYTPGAQCMIYAGTTCISIPSQGQIGPTTGSSPI